LILRDAYEAAGGHAVVAGEILEDVALARCVKQQGYRIYFTAPMGVVRTRMYRSFKAMWEGWTKNLFPLTGGNWKSLVVELIEAAPVLEFALLTLTVILCVRSVGSFFVAPALGVAFGMLLGRHIFYAAALYRNLYPVSYVQYCGVASLLYAAALVASGWKSTRGVIAWKGRAYVAKTQ